jgi:hypothetical protein
LPNKRILFLLAAGLLLAAPLQLVVAQDAETPPEPQQPFTVYTLGQQTMGLSAGLFIPLFFQSFEGAYAGTNLSLGGAGSLQWGIHLDNHWLVGLELAGMFATSIQENTLYMLPITVKGAYILQLYPFEFPIFVGTGIDIIKYQEQAQLNWIIKPGFSSIWKYNLSWGFGLNVVYWWVLQTWSPDPALGRMGNFLEVTLTAQYTF